MTVIDADQHLVESRTMWREHIDPGDRDDALEIVDDDAGHPWLTWRGVKLGLAEVQTPGETDAIGERKARARRGEPPSVRYDDALPRDHWDPDARAASLRSMGGVEAMDDALQPVGHVSLTDLAWLDIELASLEAAGVKTAMTAPALVDGRALSHPELDAAWASFVEHDIAPVFHVADQPRVFADGWYPDDRDGLTVIDSVLLHTE